MNYETMSDFEINKAVAEIRTPEIRWSSEQRSIGAKALDGVWPEVGSFCRSYCNNPSDAGPIIVENLIRILPKDDSYLGLPCARDYSGECISYTDDNNKLLRAAMIVFLKMQKETNNG